MTRLFHSFALLALLAGCSAETEGTATAVEEPAAKAPPAVALSAAEALWAATLDGPTDVVRKALDGGADVNAADPDERTALMLAAFNGRTEVVRLLLQRGARVGDRDLMGRTALMYSSTGAFVDTVELLLQNGSDPNVADKSEVWTALMFAAGEGQMEVVRMLLSYGAEPGVVDSDGDTAADHAVTKGHKEVARALRQAAGVDSGA